MKRALLLVSSVLFTASAWAGHMGGMCGMGKGGHSCGMGGGAGLKSLLFFAALYGGYWVLRQAEGEKTKLLRVIGRIVAVIILLGSLGGLLCGLCGSCRKGGGMWEKKAMSCPYSAGQPMTPTAEEASPK